MEKAIEKYVEKYKPTYPEINNNYKFSQKIEEIYKEIITTEKEDQNYNKQLTPWILLLKGLFELPCYENFNDENDFDKIEITTNDFEILNNKVKIISGCYFSHAWLYYAILKQNNFNGDKAVECLNSIDKNFRLDVLLYVNEQNPEYKILFECIKLLPGTRIRANFLNKRKNSSPLSIEEINELFNSNEDESSTKKENFSLYIIETIEKNTESKEQWHLLLKQWFNLPCYENFADGNNLDKIKITVADFKKLNELYGGDVKHYQTSWFTYFFQELLKQNKFNSENPEVLNCFKLIPEQYRVETISYIKKQNPDFIINSELKNLFPNIIEQLNFNNNVHRIKFEDLKKTYEELGLSIFELDKLQQYKEAFNKTIEQFNCDIDELKEIINVFGELNLDESDFNKLLSKYNGSIEIEKNWHILSKKLFDFPCYQNFNYKSNIDEIKITVEDFRKTNEIYSKSENDSAYLFWCKYFANKMLINKNFNVDKEFVKCFEVIQEEIRFSVLLDILEQHPQFAITDEIINLLPGNNKLKVSDLKEKINTAKNEINNVQNKTKNISGASIGSIAFVVGVPLLVIAIITFNPYLIAAGVVCVLGGSIADAVTIPKLIKRKSDLEKLESEGLENPEDEKWKNLAELCNFFYEKYLAPKLENEPEKNNIEM